MFKVIYKIDYWEVMYCCKTSVLVGWTFTSYTIDGWLVRFYHCWFIGFVIGMIVVIWETEMLLVLKKKCMWVDLRFIIFKDSGNCFKVRFFVEKKTTEFASKNMRKHITHKKSKIPKTCMYFDHTYYCKTSYSLNLYSLL